MKRPPRSLVAPEAEGLTIHHLRRLRRYFRSAGWPCQDNVELDLLARGLVRRETGGGLETVVVTDAGVALLARQLECNRLAHAEHDALVDLVARWLLVQKRLVFRDVALRTRLDDGWALSRPDVFRCATPRRAGACTRPCTRSKCAEPTCSATSGRTTSGVPTSRTRRRSTT